MTAPQPNLDDYGLSRSLGFLSDYEPSTSFSHSSFSVWDDLVRDLSQSISSAALRRRVHDLPQLDVSKLVSETDQRRAYVVLAFLVHAYVWMDLPLDPTPESAIIPPQLAEPFLASCEQVGMEPVLSYAGLCLWNWAAPTGFARDREWTSLDELTSLASFTGTRGEDAFYHVPVLIEAAGGHLVALLCDALESAQRGDTSVVVQALQQTTETIDRMKSHLPKLYTSLDADFFYHKLRPFLSGGKGMEDKGLPQGFAFQKADGSCREVKCVGGSAAQSSLFQFLDIVLGVRHESPDQSEESLFETMRSYMPRQHREFLRAMSQQPCLRTYVEQSCDEEVRHAYDDCLKQLRQWRSSHIAVVSKYIVRPARAAAAACDNADGAGDDDLKGTAGSALIPFLRQARDETK